MASAESYVQSNLPGSGIANAACVDAQTKGESAYIDPDNGASAGLVLNFGRFRTVDLGDLTWNGELPARFVLVGYEGAERRLIRPVETVRPHPGWSLWRKRRSSARPWSRWRTRRTNTCITARA